jgi:hypothetical protein
MAVVAVVLQEPQLHQGRAGRVLTWREEHQEAGVAAAAEPVM